MEKKTGEPDYYNLTLGPVSLRFQLDGIELIDNVNYSNTNRVSDWLSCPP